MHIWLVTVGEPLPTDGGDERLLRAGILAEMLSDAGHDVVWWTPAFNHSLKVARASRNHSVRVRPNYEIRMLFGGGYRRNISFERIVDHHRLAVEFARESASATRPDVIVCSFPPIELSLEAVTYGRRNGIPVILDVRDLWPDIFLDRVPRVLRPIGQTALGYFNRKVDRAFAGASAIWGHAPAFAEWGLRHAGRAATNFDGTFPFGYQVHVPAEEDIGAAKRYWSDVGIPGSATSFVACFVGTVGFQTNVEGLIETARLLPPDSGIRIVVCGTGERFVELQAKASGQSTIFFAGWRSRSEIWTLLRMASVGIAPYVDRADFVSTIPNKVPEYLSASLPIAVNLTRGRMVDLVERNDCGFSYHSDPAALAQTLVALKADPGRLATMRRNAGVVFEREFRADAVYGEMISRLQSIVDSTNGSLTRA
jgi:glycosyltransferase involved in cell wall biosynthesis